MKQGKISVAGLMIMSLILASIGTLRYSHSVVKAEDVAANLLVNGDFSGGIAGWDTYYYNGSCASGKVTEDHAFDMTINYWEWWSWDGSTYYQIDWQAMLIQSVYLEEGKQYTVQFDAYASEDRSIRAKIKDNDAWGEYFDLTTEKKTYQYSFNCTKTYQAELQFLLGYVEHGSYAVPEGKHDVYFSDIYLVEGDGSNIVKGSSTKDDTETEIPEIDDSKEYYIVKSYSSGKVLEAFGKNANSPIIQSTYKEKYSQVFSMEDMEDGKFMLRSLWSGYVVGIAGNSSDNSAKLVQQEISDSEYIKWTGTKVSQGYYTFTNAGSGKVMDVPGASSSEGTQIAQYESNGTKAQQWDLIKIDVKKIVAGANVPDTSTADTWKKNTIISPKEKKLTAAGPISLEWYNNKEIGNVVGYEINFDDEDTVTVAATEDEIMEYEWYNTSVSKHEVTVTAIFGDSTKITSDKRTFFVSKKGVGWSSLYRTEEMNLSWYYQWSMEEAAGTDTNIQFVPMVWGNWGNSWLGDASNQKFKTVLGFNEPDFASQSNVTVEDALAAWKDFSDSGLRVGSPCTAIGAYWSKDWFWKFMDGVDADPALRVDFITIHCYLDNCSAEAFLSLIDETWNKWHRPIWITEFGIAEWSSGIWNKDTEGANDKVYAFMQEVLPELDKREYVERYAWFPFDPNDKWGGSSGLFDYDTGELNALGMLYAESGMPQGYDYVKYTDDLEEDNGLELNGFQVSATTKGMRTIYSVEPEINGLKVVQAGLVYGLTDYAQESELYVGSDSEYVRAFEAKAGKMNQSVSSSETAESYAMTVKFGAYTDLEYKAEWMVRVFARLSDGTYVYSDIDSYSAEKIAGYLYDNQLMTTASGHNYLYDEILSVVNKDYTKKEFNAENSIVSNIQ